MFGNFLTVAAYTPQAVPSPQPMTFSSVGDIWQYAQSMLQDTLAIISNYPILVAIIIALPLLGVGIGLFKRLLHA